jgi:hypothetical protein
MAEPYGANEQLAKWVADTGYRYSHRAHCLHWLCKGRCAVRFCHETRSSYQWMDHVSGWLTPDGERLLLCQPYHLEPSTLVDACRHFGLRADISGAGWYGHGTVAIELRKAK